MKKHVFILLASLLVALTNTIFAQNGVLNKFAGGGTTLGDNGPAIDGQLNLPTSMAIDKFGNIYITDHYNYRIRKVNSFGVITTVAGNGTEGSTGDGGLAIDAELDTLSGIAVDVHGNIYFTNGCRIRKIDTSGIITTIAGGTYGFGGDGGPAVDAQISNVNKIAVDTAGNIYIGDCANNRIRKINTSGIINTIAGTGVSGFSGDGGPATSAELSTPYGITLDKTGNIYFSDWGNNRVRKIDNTGIISTIAGNGSAGFSGDGGLATLAELSGVIDVAVDGTGNVFIADHDNYRIRKINAANGIINTIAGTGVSGSTFYGYANTSRIVPYGMIIDDLNNLYFCDEVGYAYRIQQLASIQFFYDENNDCIWDNTEPPVNLPFLIAVDSNGVRIDTLSATSNLSYNTHGNVGDIYDFAILAYSSELTPSCFSSLTFSDTINSLNGNYFIKNIGFKCLGTTMDLSINSAFSQSGIHIHQGSIFVSNLGCYPQNAIVTVNLNDEYPSIDGEYPSAASVSGNIITWDLSGLTSTRPVIELTYGMGIGTHPFLPLGIPVQDTVAITPTIGDSNPLNNYIVIIDTTRAGFDPNEMIVTPSYCVNPGTQLQYAIAFENTGNDTAFNIFIIDTLSNNLDPQSLRVLSATAAMNTTRSYINGHNVLQFVFPNINLLDSSHHGLCDGMVQYTINTYSGLPVGTAILNHAGIYFDSNAVVMTNTVEDIMGNCATASVKNIPQTTGSTVSLFPNPATTSLTILMSQNAYTSFTITNSIGQDMIQQPLITTQTQVNVAALPPGLYYIILRGDNGTTVQKFVKM